MPSPQQALCFRRSTARFRHGLRWAPEVQQQQQQQQRYYAPLASQNKGWRSSSTIHSLATRSVSSLGKKHSMLEQDYRYPPPLPSIDDNALQEDLLQDYEDLIQVARQRKLHITVHTGTKAGIVTGLLVMGGVIVAGPVGAVVGGTLGTGWAIRASHGSGVSVAQIFRETPLKDRPKVCREVVEALKSEFSDGLASHPEVKLMLSKKKGRMGTTMSVVKYCLDKRMMDDTKLQKLDDILQEHAAKKIQ